MFVFKIDDPNIGLGQVMMDLSAVGITSDSRNGPVIRFPEPVALQYTDPQRRILDHPLREANHFFHLQETMWMLAGLNTVAPLDPFLESFKQYSDNGINFAAAYGHRWRKLWGDQIHAIVHKLKHNPLDRRVVLQMWDPNEIFKTEGLDFACNQQVLFSVREMGVGHVLDITVTNRSNDLIYGAMGSNLFHFSMLHEYIAHHTGMAVGEYTHISVNMHLYLENPASKKCWENRENFTEASLPRDTSLLDYGLPLDMETIQKYVNDYGLTLVGDYYLDKVAGPLARGYLQFKDKSKPINDRIDLATNIVKDCSSPPLRRACLDWLERRRK